MKLVEEADEAALGVVRACVGRRLVGDASLAEKIGEAARYAGVVNALQRVGASAIGCSRLAALAGEKKGPVQNRSPDDGAPRPTVGAKCRGLGST